MEVLSRGTTIVRGSKTSNERAGTREFSQNQKIKESGAAPAHKLGQKARKRAKMHRKCKKRPHGRLSGVAKSKKTKSNGGDNQRNQTAPKRQAAERAFYPIPQLKK